MTAGHVRDLAAFGELIERVGPRRLEQPPAIARGVGRHQRFGHQIGDPFRHAGPGGAEIAHHGGRGLDGEAAGEDAQGAEQAPLGLGQEVVAPAERRGERPVSRQGRPAALGQQQQAAVEERAQLAHAEGVDPGGRQLDGQRQPVQPLADLRHDRHVGVGELEVLGAGAGAVDEQPHGAEGERRGRVHPGRRRGRLERRHAQDALALRPQRLPAGRQQADTRGGPQQLLREEGRSVGEVLAIVEHDQDLALAQVGEDARGRIVGRAGGRAEGRGERVRHQRSVGEGCEVDHADAVAERRPEPVGDRERQGRLADPARPDERDEAPALQAADDHVDERVPPDGPRDAVGQYRTVPRGRLGRLQHLGRERADEAVPASGHRRDVAGGLAIVAESASQRGDLRPEVALVDGDAGPGTSDELVPRHHLARSLGECHQNLERPTPERDGLVALQQQLPSGREPERPERDLPCLRAGRPVRRDKAAGTTAAGGFHQSCGRTLPSGRHATSGRRGLNTHRRVSVIAYRNSRQITIGRGARHHSTGYPMPAGRGTRGAPARASGGRGGAA